MCSMIWFTITDQETDQTPNGKLSNLLVGTAAQITDSLKRFKAAGMTMRCSGPRSAMYPCPRPLDDLERLNEEIMPKVDAS